MNLSIRPDRLIRASGELFRAEKTLRNQAVEIETVISSMRRNEDEASQTVAAKLEKTLESLNGKRRCIQVTATALEKIAALYKRTEDNISSYEDTFIEVARAQYYATRDISGIAKRAGRTFEKF